MKIRIEVYAEQNTGAPSQVAVVDLPRGYTGQVGLNLIEGHLSSKVERKETIHVDRTR